MFKKIIGLAIVVFCFTSCSNDLLNTCEVGNLVDITAIPTSFNESIKSKVKTTKMVFIVQGTPSGIIGEPVILRTYERSRCLCISGSTKCWKIRR